MVLTTVHISVMHHTTCHLNLRYSNLVTTKRVTFWSLTSPSCPSIHLPTHPHLTLCNKATKCAASSTNFPGIFLKWLRITTTVSVIPNHFQSEISMGIIKYETDVLIGEPWCSGALMWKKMGLPTDSRVGVI